MIDPNIVIICITAVVCVLFASAASIGRRK